MADTDESTALAVIAQEPLSIAVKVAADIKRKLGAATPREYRLTRKGPAGKMLEYAPWGYTSRVLNSTYGPAWSMTITDIKVLPLPPLPAKKPVGKEPGRDAVEREEVVVTCLVETPFGKMHAVGSHIYFPTNGEIGYGDVIQSAQSQALKRAGARWGIALDLYLKEQDDIPDPEAPAEVAADGFAAKCKEYGFTEKQAIALLSEVLAGDQNDLRTLADIMEAGGFMNAEAVALALEDAVTAMTRGAEPAAKKRTRKVATK